MLGICLSLTRTRHMNQTGNAQYTVPKIVVAATRLYPRLVFLKLPEEVRDALEDHEKDTTSLFSHRQQSILVFLEGACRGVQQPMTYRS